LNDRFGWDGGTSGTKEGIIDRESCGQKDCQEKGFDLTNGSAINDIFLMLDE